MWPSVEPLCGEWLELTMEHESFYREFRMLCYKVWFIDLTCSHIDLKQTFPHGFLLSDYLLRRKDCEFYVGEEPVVPTE
jgi:hypothetical protein